MRTRIAYCLVVAGVLAGCASIRKRTDHPVVSQPWSTQGYRTYNPPPAGTPDRPARAIGR